MLEVYIIAKLRCLPGCCLGSENWTRLKHQNPFFCVCVSKQHCVAAPLAMHSVTVNLESTNSLNTTTQKFSDKQNPTQGSNTGLRCFCHCFPPMFSNVCSPFLRTCAPKEGASEPGLQKLTACSKDLWWSVLGMSWTVHAFPELQWGNRWRSFPETLRLGQSNITSSLKKR